MMSHRAVSRTARVVPHAVAFLPIVALLAAGVTPAGATGPAVSEIVTDAAARARYLAHATIWKDPGVLSPDDIRSGPSGVFPYTSTEAMAADGIACTFEKPGIELSGKSPKFLCTTSEGRQLRLKYWDAEHATGNREVFATVAATRLMWALGFNVLHALPINVRCERCPENPMAGKGAAGTRRYLAELQEYPTPGPLILSRATRDQGWSWREFDRAIAALDPGPERTRQRTHFDALALLGVLMQHGDRKPAQQALYCDATVDLPASDLRPSPDGEKATTVVERSNAAACARAAAVIVDVGATFGGGGRESRNDTAKMNLAEWRHKPVWKDAGGDTCRGELTLSLAAGRDGEGNPEISEEGRLFLLEQLHRLTPEHVRALFTAARVDELAGSLGNTRTGADPAAVDEWVAVFQDKVQQIETHRCQPAS